MNFQLESLHSLLALLYEQDHKIYIEEYISRASQVKKNEGLLQMQEPI